MLSETRKYEDGIASNRKLECYGEYVLRSCTHRPSRYGNLFCWKIWLFNNWFIAKEGLKWSRNKVAVGEPVAGKFNQLYYSIKLLFKSKMLEQINNINISSLLFLISIIGIFLNQKNILIMLMSLEMMFLAVSFNLVFASIYLDDILGQIFSLLILTVAAAESSIGLAILVVYYRIRNIITVELMNLMKG